MAAGAEVWFSHALQSTTSPWPAFLFWGLCFLLTGLLVCFSAFVVCHPVLCWQAQRKYLAKPSLPHMIFWVEIFNTRYHCYVVSLFFAARDVGGPEQGLVQPA